MMTSHFSRLVSDALDCIGYSEQSITVRAQILKECINIQSQHFSDLFQMELILAGSKSEGVVPIHGSDHDVMCVLQSCVSVDHGRLEDRLTILEKNSKGCPPGYTKLRPLRIEHRGLSFNLNLCSFYDTSSGTLFLTSAAFTEMLTQNKYRPVYDGMRRFNKELSGPALSITLQPCLLMGISQNSVYGDLVFAITYYSSNILHDWAERKRHFDWPPHDVIEDVSTTEGYVVPIGHKLSEEQNFEWRICYTTGERKLIASFNETQLKLYVILKMVLKDILKPTIDCLSSYMIKNIVFWILECNAMSSSTPSNLTKFVAHALWFLLYCLRNNHLPNYMISKRNLLNGRVQSHQKTVLKKLLRELLSNGETFLLRCEKLKCAVYITVANRCLATKIQSWRDEIEQLLLLFNLKLSQKDSKKHKVLKRTLFYDQMLEVWKDEAYLPIAFRLFCLLSLDVTEIFRNGMNGIQKIGNILHDLLS